MKMNKIFLCYILLAVCLLSACIGNENKTAKGIVGKWKFLDIEYDVDVPNTNNIDKLENIFDGYEAAIREELSSWTMEFTSDGKAIGNSPKDDTYTISGDTLLIDLGMKMEIMKFRIEGDTLITEVDVTRDIVSSISVSAEGDEFNIKKCICKIVYVRKK